MSLDRLRHGVEIAVEKLDYVVSWPEVGQSLVKSRRSQIRIAALTVTPLPRVVAPARICSLACGPT